MDSATWNLIGALRESGEREHERFNEYLALVRAAIRGETVHMWGRPVRFSIEWLDGCPFTEEQMLKMLAPLDASH